MQDHHLEPGVCKMRVRRFHPVASSAAQRGESRNFRSKMMAIIIITIVIITIIIIAITIIIIVAIIVIIIIVVRIMLSSVK